MFLFPMKAKYFVAILGLIEVVLVLNNGATQGKVSALSHVTGILAGYIFLKLWPRIRGMGGPSAKPPKKKGRGELKLVVNNDPVEKSDGPKYWN
jgi:hypothetical protein